ncbi:MAG: type II pantothenate kinase [Defluviitaleaceae bacterium]|nr:type II pantothenate kinase [Defluviitaleaceae bacterium]
MRITIGIDIGGSTTKIIGIRGNEILAPTIVRANDPVASLFGAFGKFVDSGNLSLPDIAKIMITGVGSSFITKPIYGLPTAKVAEFLANGLGGLHLSGLDRAVIVSMGTGTSLVLADHENIAHIGGTGMGGGTIMGLSSRMLNIRDIQLIIQTAENGDLSNIDLRVGDLTNDALPGLPSYTTASNFGRISDVASNSDIALGIINLVLQSIGMTAVFSARNTGLDKAVLIGKLTAIPQCPAIFAALTELFGVSFIIPENSEYATAVGAALAFLREREYVEL